MKKKILSLLIAVLMIVPVLVSCGDEIMTIINSHPNAITLTLYTIKGDNTTDEAVAKTEEALNAITETEMDIHIKLCMYTKDEYMNVIHEKMDTLKKMADDGYFNNLIVEEEEEEEETEAEETTAKEEDEKNTKKSRGTVDEDTMEFVYPEAEDYQLDIFLLTSLDDLNKAISAGMVTQLDGLLGGTYHLIGKYLSPNFTNNYKLNGLTYAVANNHAISDYEYILINKSKADALGYNADSISSLATFNAFIKAAGGTAVETYQVTPQASSVTPEDSLLGAYIGRDPAEDLNAMPRNLLSVPKYVEDLEVLHSLRSSGTLKESAEFDENATAVFIKGGPNIAEKYSDKYYPCIYKYPTATNSDVFGGMYCVGRYTQSISQCMDIIKYLVTDPAVINILKYGSLDDHYVTEKDHYETEEENSKLKFIDIISDDYYIDTLYAGNEFLNYQNDKMTDDELAFSADWWAAGKKQNLSVRKDPYLTFSPRTTEILLDDGSEKEEMPDDIDTVLDNVIDLSEEYFEKISEDGYKSYVASKGDISYTDYIALLADELDGNKYFREATSSRYSNSPYTKYLTWYKLNNGGETE